jgi:peptidoglycan/xylan/chitin deacetylase (PgdA/CDA1 family)
MTLFSRWLPALLLCLACARGRPPVPILNYHSVGPGGDEFTVAPGDFERQLDFLVSAGLRTVSLDDLVQRRDVSRAVVLTFDDGTEDALTRVLPALRKRGMRATFFLITGLVGKPGYLTWDGVRTLAAAGMEIGSHSVDHAHLAEESDERVREELTASKRELEAQLHAPVEVLAYPYNSVRKRIERAAAEAGYRAAVAGVVHGGKGLLNLYRVTIRRNTSLDEFRRLALGG